LETLNQVKNGDGIYVNENGRAGYINIKSMPENTPLFYFDKENPPSFVFSAGKMFPELPKFFSRRWI
jgi:hypothetical protein